MRRIKLLSVALATAMIMSMTGCGGNASGIETIPVGNNTSQGNIIIPASSTAPVWTTEATSSTDESSSEAPSGIVIDPSSEAPTVPPSSANPAEGFTPVSQIVRVTTNLNLRIGPGTDYDSAGLVAEGTQVTRYGIGDGWSQIIYNANSYYVASQYLELVTDGQTLDPNETAPTTPEATAPTGPVAPDPGVDKLNFAGWSLADLATISNENIPFGYSSNNRDEYNRPSGCTQYYTNLYGKYGANFIAPNTNQIYLTMDEGYEAGFTPAILDTLAAKNVKALFFLTKQFVTENPELVTRMINEGHVIGNHTCSHPSGGLPQLGLEKEYNDITWLQTYVKDNWGYEMKLFRYPEGMFSEQSLALVNSLGLTPVFWSFAHADWNTSNQPDVAASLQRVLAEIHPGAIYLLHACSSTNTTILGDFIDGARARGFEFGVYPQTGF